LYVTSSLLNPNLRSSLPQCFHLWISH
jgi:hypothetical protein